VSGSSKIGNFFYSHGPLTCAHTHSHSRARSSAASSARATAPIRPGRLPACHRPAAALAGMGGWKKKRESETRRCHLFPRRSFCVTHFESLIDHELASAPKEIDRCRVVVTPPRPGRAPSKGECTYAVHTYI
jgi:hypothetical protein